MGNEHRQGFTGEWAEPCQNCGYNTVDHIFPQGEEGRVLCPSSSDRPAAEETPTPSLEERNAKHKQWQDVVRSKGYISELSKVLSFISFSNDEHTWLEIKFESGTVRMDLYENKIKVVGPFLFSKQTALNAAEITFNNDLPNKQIAAAKAEWASEGFDKSCVLKMIRFAKEGDWKRFDDYARFGAEKTGDKYLMETVEKFLNGWFGPQIFARSSAAEQIAADRLKTVDDFVERVDSLAKSLHAEYYENGAQDGDCDWTAFSYTAMRSVRKEIEDGK